MIKSVERDSNPVQRSAVLVRFSPFSLPTSIHWKSYLIGLAEQTDQDSTIKLGIINLILLNIFIGEKDENLTIDHFVSSINSILEKINSSRIETQRITQ